MRGTSLPLISHTRATFNSRTGEVQLPEQSGKPDDIEIECPKNERRSCGKNSFGEFLLNAARAKKVYADQHGYRFVLMDSNDFKGERGSGGRTGEFAKPHMMRHALLDPNLCGWQQQVAPETFRGKCDWIMWLDADSFIHPALFDLPLDAWLHDVPDDRILVLGNRVALNTGVLFLRAGNQSTRTQTISLLDNSKNFEFPLFFAKICPIDFCKLWWWPISSINILLDLKMNKKKKMVKKIITIANTR